MGLIPTHYLTLTLNLTLILSMWSGANGALDCLNKGDRVMLLNTDLLLATDISTLNPIYPDIYTVTRVVVDPYLNPPATASAYSTAQQMTR